MSFHQVYANGRSICSKSGTGKSAAAFPDVCWTPPQSTPVPIPYPNTAYASDLTNGTKTVFIQGAEVAKKDSSYFSTSTGDEAATQTCGKGLITAALKGKAYFFSWSMDVKAEKKNVCRHLDMMGHNHASVPSNTPLFPFIEHGAFKRNPCSKEEERVEEACAEDKEEKDKDKKKFKRKKKKRFTRLKKKNKTKDSKSGGGWHWKDDHCDGLDFFPTLDNAKEFLDDLESAYKDMFSQEALLDKAKSELWEYLEGAAAKATAKVLAKAGLKQAAGSSVPLLGNIAMGLWTAYDVYQAVSSIDDLRKIYNEVVDYVETLKDKLPRLKDLLDKYKNEGGSAKLMADVMDVVATVNPCTRARKCMLVPYKKKGSGNRKAETSTGAGCCGGQTGHHLIPGAMAERCPNYEHSIAPTVCVEGANQNQGSHKRIHDQTDAMLRLKQSSGKITNTGLISRADAIDAAADAHKISFPMSKCSAKCIKAQLENYYSQACPRTKLSAKDKNGKLIQGDSGGSQGRA